jgi:hypothetical protein
MNLSGIVAGFWRQRLSLSIESNRVSSTRRWRQNPVSETSYFKYKTERWKISRILTVTDIFLLYIIRASAVVYGVGIWNGNATKMVFSYILYKSFAVKRDFAKINYLVTGSKHNFN